MENRGDKRKSPVLYLVLPCYNEEAVLPVSIPMFLEKLEEMLFHGKIDQESRVLLVDDGSRDRTWELICQMAEKDCRCIGIRQSRNRGHQNAILAGMMEARKLADAVITADCDGQDDMAAMEEMVDAYLDGCDIVYGVRRSRELDTGFKRMTAEGFYRLMKLLGAETVYNHADYRLVSRQVLEELEHYQEVNLYLRGLFPLIGFLEHYQEVNLYLRGLFPLIGFKSTTVLYDRKARIAGETHYPLRKMIGLAIDGITSLSVKPLHLIAGFGLGVSLLSMLGIIWSVYEYFRNATIPGWSSTICIICFLSGVQLISIGILGEYLGKTYMEVKKRPRYIISERTGGKEEGPI